MHKRQRYRKALILISFLFFPLTIYYLSPALIILGAAEGIVAGSFIAFVLMFLFSLFLGVYSATGSVPGAGCRKPA